MHRFSALLDPGWYKQSSVNRYTLNVNLTQHLSDKLSLNLIGGAAYRKQRAPGTLGQDVDVVGGEVKRDFDINPYSLRKQHLTVYLTHQQPT